MNGSLKRCTTNPQGSFVNLKTEIAITRARYAITAHAYKSHCNLSSHLFLYGFAVNTGGLSVAYTSVAAQYAKSWLDMAKILPSQIPPIGMQVHGRTFHTEAPHWEHSVPSVRTWTNPASHGGGVLIFFPQKCK